MKKLLPIFFICGLMLTGLLVNSCKKDTQGTVEALLARGKWQLATIEVRNYIGGTNTSNDTLNTSCLKDQFFTFNTDQTCTYNNFSCMDQTTTGKWSFADDKLTLYCDMTAKDTVGTIVKTTSPFANARVVNLGQYSLILETGDISSVYKSTDKRHIKHYGFIRFQ